MKPMKPINIRIWRQMIVALLLANPLLAPVAAQEKQAGQGAAQSSHHMPLHQAEAPRPAMEFGLEDGIVVKLRLRRELSSASEQTGARVEFEVIEEVKVGEALLIKRGAEAIGTVTEAKPKRRMGRSGKLSVRIDTVTLANGAPAPLRAIRSGPDRSRKETVASAVALSGLLFFPAAPFFLLIKGGDITVPKGTLVTAFINGNLPLDRTQFAAPQASEGDRIKKELPL